MDKDNQTISREKFMERQQENMAIHIFSVSAAMIGVCFTVIGILHISHVFKKIQHIGDGITAVDALLFLCSCIISFIAMRTSDKNRRLKLETISDYIFLSSLTLMVLICILVGFEFI